MEQTHSTFGKASFATGSEAFAVGTQAAAHADACPLDASHEAAVADESVDREDFMPLEPETFEQLGLSETDIESLVLKALMNYGTATGRQLAEQLKLPFGLLQQMLQMLKAEMIVQYAKAAAMSDYEYELTSSGLERARRYNERCTYFGAAPVSLDHYIESVRRQSVRGARPRLSDLCEAFQDLVISAGVISQIGQAVNSGRGLFLYGPPGNGKTSIAERVIRGLKSDIWIPRTITVGGEIIRMYDPSNHHELPMPAHSVLLNASRIDRRWVRIRRPTVIVGGELTLQHLEITYNRVTGINETPLQFKSNCGALVIDDFGRQRVSATELLNRWIVPLEKGFDYLGLPSGRQIQVPFDQILVFATNLEPKQLVDEAFLRRIPYKIEVSDPSEQQFRDLFAQLCAQSGVEYSDNALVYLIDKHFKAKGRHLRYCHARDLLEQVKNFCEFHERPFELTRESMDEAAKNYFAGL